jgi:hypothetical protein
MMSVLPDIPGYRVVHSLGSGATADVFEAEEESTSRRVAIKLMRGQIPSAGEVARFRREREILGGLSHPNLLRVHSAGSFEGRPFVVTELLDGRALDERATPSLPWEEALELTLQAADGLAVIHCAGLVHRDVKPANLLLTEDRQVKVADLGLVAGQELSTLTNEGSWTGTLAYMAPEGVRGEKLREPSCDVYSLGATLFELLTGDPPNASSVTLTELLAARNQNPTPATSSFPSQVPASVVLVCRKAMDGDPSRRHIDAAEFASALRNATAGGRRGSWTLGVAAGALCVVALGLAALSSGPADAPTPATPSASLSPTRAAAPVIDLEALEERLSRGEAAAQIAARDWIAAHPKGVSAARRLEDAHLRAAFAGAPQARASRSLSFARHVPWGYASEEKVLWVELCVLNRGSCGHSGTRGVVGWIGDNGAFRSLSGWRWGHVTAVSPHGSLLAAGRQGQVIAREGDSFRELGEPIGAQITSLTVDERGVALGSNRGQVLCLDPTTGAIRWTRQAHRGAVRGVVWRTQGLVSLALDEVTPLACTSPNKGLERPLKVSVNLAPVGWAIPGVASEQVLCGLVNNHTVLSLGPGPAQSFVGAQRFEASPSGLSTGRWAPSVLPSRWAVVCFDRFLCVVGSQRLGSQTRSQRRLFALGDQGEVSAQKEDTLAYSTVTLSLEGLLTIGAYNGEQGTLTVRRLTLPR